MAELFSGFSKQTLTFFRQLSRNNDRNWFAPRKELYESIARDPMRLLAATINERLREVSVHHVTDPKKAVYRLYRDTRFSKDKTPYKDHVAALFPYAKLPKNDGAGFYVSVNHRHVEIAGGIYMPSPEALLTLRGSLVKRFGELENLLADKKLQKLMGRLQGESLTRVPKGFDPQTPAAEWVKRKQFYFGVTLPPEVALEAKFAELVMRRFEVMLPVMHLLNECVTGEVEDAVSRARKKWPKPMF